MKKLFALALILAVTLSFSACSVEDVLEKVIPALQEQSATYNKIVDGATSGELQEMLPDFGTDGGKETEMPEIDYQELIDNFVPDNLNTFTLSVGESHKPSASLWLNGEGGNMQTDVYSSNPAVAEVGSLGKVTGIAPGEAYIIITASNGLNSLSQVYKYIVE